MAGAKAKDARLPLATSLAFSATSLPLMAMGISVSIHMPAFFAANIGLPLAAVAAAFGTVRLIDVPLEMVLGLGMDRTRSRFGRYRMWMMAGAPILMLGLYMLLSASKGAGAGYLVVWLLVMYLGASILTLAHAAWASTLARTYDERARLFGLMAFVGVAGALSVVIIPAVMSKLGYSDADSVRGMLWYVVLLVPLAVGLVVARTPERVVEETAGPRFRFRDYLELVTHPNMRRILLQDLVIQLAGNWAAAVYIFFTRDALGFSSASTNLLLLGNLGAGFVGAPAIAWLATRISKHRALMVAAAGNALSYLLMAFTPHGEVGLFLMASIFAGTMFSGCNVMTRAMTADVAEEIRLQQGKEQSALLYAMVTLTSKVAAGLAVFLAFGLLSRVGYDPQLGKHNAPGAIDALVLVYAAGPVSLNLLGLACLRGYSLTRARAADIRARLEARDAALLPS